jgi:hypothetical protein
MQSEGNYFLRILKSFQPGEVIGQGSLINRFNDVSGKYDGK